MLDKHSKGKKGPGSNLCRRCQVGRGAEEIP